MDWRIGAVNYLNSKPLIEGLTEFLPDTHLRLDYPSRLADKLTDGQLDVALIPSIEYFRGHDYEIVSDACVAAKGPVLSVKLYSRVPWASVKSLALDEGSRTSAALARVMLAERFGIFPRLEPLPLDHRTQDTDADAILLIGDRAILAPPEKFHATWDLGEQWFQWTGLPFVFAMWVARRRMPKDLKTSFGHVAAGESLRLDGDRRPPNGVAVFEPLSHIPEAAVPNELDAIGNILSQSRDLGVARLAEISRREASLLSLSVPTTYKYLSENLQFHLGNAERSGLRQFYELAAGLELAPKGVNLIFRHPARSYGTASSLFASVPIS